MAHEWANLAKELLMEPEHMSTNLRQNYLAWTCPVVVQPRGPDKHRGRGRVRLSRPVDARLTRFWGGVEVRLAFLARMLPKPPDKVRVKVSRQTGPGLGERR